MFKTIIEILNYIIDLKNKNTVLSEVNSASKTSLWRQFLEVVSTAYWAFVNVRDLHDKETDFLIQEQKVPNQRWYRNKALSFQYGFDVEIDTDIFKPTIQVDGVDVEATEEQIEASKVIKYCAVDRKVIANRASLIIKIAGEENGEIIQTSDDVKNGLKKWFEIDGAAAAGDVITYINYKGDILSFSVDVYVNPLVMMSDGRHKINLNYPVEDSIKTYLKNLPFNGEFDVQKFEAAILATEGVLKLKTNKVESKWIVAQGGDVDGYGLFQPISVYKIPESGYFKVEDFKPLIIYKNL